MSTEQKEGEKREGQQEHKDGKEHEQEDRGRPVKPHRSSAQMLKRDTKTS